MKTPLFARRAVKRGRIAQLEHELRIVREQRDSYARNLYGAAASILAARDAAYDERLDNEELIRWFIHRLTTLCEEAEQQIQERRRSNPLLGVLASITTVPLQT